MRLVIYGAGALGSYFGAKLCQQGHNVVFIARGRQLEALRTRGISVVSADEQFDLPSVQVTDDPAGVGKADYVLLAVKTWHIETVLPHLPGMVGADTRVLTLQNGVETPQIIGSVIGIAHVLAGVVRGFFAADAPGTVRHLGVRPSILFGQITHQKTAHASRLLECLLSAGIHAEIPENIDTALWEKFMLVCAVSGVGAVTRVPIGAIREFPQTWQMLEGCMHEIARVAQAYDIPLSDDVVQRTMRFVDTFPFDATSSMQRDIMQGLPSELEAQTGAVVRLAAAQGIAVPIHEFIYASLVLQEQQARRTLEDRVRK